MAIPASAVSFTGVLDPHEVLDYLIPLGPVLEEGETATTYSLDLLPEAVALGLTIMSGDGRDHALVQDGTAISMWLTIDDAFVADPAFDGAGTALPMQFTIETNSNPSRTRQRTFLAPVAQQ